MPIRERERDRESESDRDRDRQTECDREKREGGGLVAEQVGTTNVQARIL
jgi:hypothetical protein